MNPRLSENTSGNPTLSVPPVSFNAGERKLIILLYLAVIFSSQFWLTMSCMAPDLPQPRPYHYAHQTEEVF